MSILAASKINQLLQLGHKGGLYFAKLLSKAIRHSLSIATVPRAGFLPWVVGLFIAQAMNSPLSVH